MGIYYIGYIGIVFPYSLVTTSKNCVRVLDCAEFGRKDSAPQSDLRLLLGDCVSSVPPKKLLGGKPMGWKSEPMQLVLLNRLKTTVISNNNKSNNSNKNNHHRNTNNNNSNNNNNNNDNSNNYNNDYQTNLGHLLLLLVLLNQAPISLGGV